MSMLEKFWKVLASPKEAFAAIAQDPRIIWPGLIIIAISLTCTLVNMPETRVYTEQTMAASGMSPDQIALTMNFVVPIVIIGTIFALPLFWLVEAAILALYNQISVGEARFKQLFSVAVFAGIPLIIKTVIFAGLIKTMGYKNALQVSTSLAIFSGNADSAGFFYRLLGQIELFSIWGLILLILGGAIAMKKKPRGLAVFLGVIWLIYVVVMALVVKTPAV